MTTILCHDIVEYYTVKSTLLDRGMFFIGASELTRGKSYLQIDETSFKQITKQEYDQKESQPAKSWPQTNRKRVCFVQD